jgi:hypothetical protein
MRRGAVVLAALCGLAGPGRAEMAGYGFTGRVLSAQTSLPGLSSLVAGAAVAGTITYDDQASWWSYDGGKTLLFSSPEAATLRLGGVAFRSEPAYGIGADILWGGDPPGVPSRLAGAAEFLTFNYMALGPGLPDHPMTMDPWPGVTLYFASSRRSLGSGLPEDLSSYAADARSMAVVDLWTKGGYAGSVVTSIDEVHRLPEPGALTLAGVGATLAVLARLSGTRSRRPGLGAEPLRLLVEPLLDGLAHQFGPGHVLVPAGRLLPGQSPQALHRLAVQTNRD